MNYPGWITASDLGTFSQDYSFDLNTIQILFSASSNSTVILLNGVLPPGVNFVVNTNNLLITGVPTSTGNYQFTFRISQINGFIADRTFNIIITPLVIAPSWENQLTFLGYQTNVEINTYQLQATAPPGQIVFYSLPNEVVGESIDKISGILTYQPNNISTNTTTNIIVRATSVGSSNITVGIGVRSIPTPPIWITPSNLGTFYGNEFIELHLEAQDPFTNNVEYLLSLSSNISNIPLTLTSTGVLYGRVNNPLENTVYTFQIIAESTSGLSPQNFSLAIDTSLSNSSLYWNTPVNLGSINEGEYIKLQISATSLRNTLVIYNVTGGLLPPHLVLGTTDGMLVGFCEYHAYFKTYYFDVTANDGYQTITQQFTLTVNKIYSNQFFNMYIPITGDLRTSLFEDSSNIHVRVPGTLTFETMNNIIDPPIINIINGLETGDATAGQIISVVKEWFNQLDLYIGVAGNTNVLTSGSSLIYRTINDSQYGTSSVISDSYVQNGNVYPVSINNIRSALTNNWEFVLSGGGNGCTLFPVLNWSTGGIQSITVLSSGSNYIVPPSILISGSGSGAIARAVIGVVDVVIINGGISWSVGDSFTLLGNYYNTPAELMVTGVNQSGAIISLQITQPGDYLQINSSNIVTVSNSIFDIIWGVVNVDIINSGNNYQCGVTVNISNNEILPEWQQSYFPVIESGTISSNVAAIAANILNNESNTLWGTSYQPLNIVFQWQGLTWLGLTSFDIEETTFDGNSMRLQETQDPPQLFNVACTSDGLSYDFFDVWGGTLIDCDTTVFDLYSTIFDPQYPRTKSNTILQQWITIQNKTYSSANPIW